MGVHTDGTIYWTGSFNEQSTHGPITLTGDGRDIFTARYASDGTPIWAKSTPGTADHEAYDIVPLSDGSPVIFARLRGIATFGATTLDGSSNVGAIARFRPDGDF